MVCLTTCMAACLALHQDRCAARSMDPGYSNGRMSWRICWVACSRSTTVAILDRNCSSRVLAVFPSEMSSALYAEIQELKDQQKRLREETKATLRTLRNARRRVKRLKTKSKDLSLDDLQELLGHRLATASLTGHAASSTGTATSSATPASSSTGTATSSATPASSSTGTATSSATPASSSTGTATSSAAAPSAA